MSFAELILAQYGLDAAFQVTGGSIQAPPDLRPTFRYLVAFQNLPTDDPTTFTLPNYLGGQVGGGQVYGGGFYGANDYGGQLGGVGQWTDITPFVMSHRISRGRQHELQQFEAGTCELVLSNRDGRFNPWNTAGPYYGFLTPRKLVQVRVTWNGVTYTRFTGHVDAWPVEWPDQFTAWTTLHATDAFRFFNLNNVVSAGYANQVVADGASSYWRFGEPAGSGQAHDQLNSSTTLFPTSGYGAPTYGNTGAMVADPGTCATFTTSTAAIAALNQVTQSSLSSTTGASIEFWFNAPAPAGTTQFVSRMFVNLPGTGFFEHEILINGGASPSVQVQLDTAVTASKNICDGAWHHVVGTATLTSPSTVFIYVDGVQVATGTPNWTTAGDFANVVEFITLSSGASASAQEMAVYPSVLTAAQVTKHYQLAAFPQQSSDARIGHTLDAVSWSSTARNIDTNTSATVQAVTSPLTTTSSLSHMQAVENTEGGALFMGTDGRVRFISRQTTFSNPLYTQSQVVIGDSFVGNDLPFDPSPTIAIDDIDLYNEATATRQNGLTQRTVVASSITSYGRSTWQPPSQLLGISDAEVLAMTQYVTFKFGTPVTRVQSVTVDLLNLITPNLVGNLLSLDLLYQVTVERLGVPGGGQGFSQTANIEKITEIATPDQYKVSFALAKANPPFWVLGKSRLGIDTTLAW